MDDVEGNRGVRPAGHECGDRHGQPAGCGVQFGRDRLDAQIGFTVVIGEPQARDLAGEPGADPAGALRLQREGQVGPALPEFERAVREHGGEQSRGLEVGHIEVDRAGQLVDH